MMEHTTTHLKLVLGGIAAAGSMAFAGLCLSAGVAFAAPGDPGGGGYANDSAGGGYATGEAGGGYATGSAGGGYARGEAGGGYATGDAGGAWFREACEAASEAGEPAPIGCAS
ncbi:hypothetical protein A5731_08395 [Mycolicibacterium conceptionense]|jgi:hypothetical protein|uniref:Lipoprotein n=2 Tax=Mycolicibacterium conceptionense TaxID=451644 RepID=A0A1A2V229_9MYCO|nr:MULTISPECIES: hypothetical protein [Mycolicibacterium]MCW1823413.1 hypothetical protein [Mycolicibacterium senegalense]OBB11472.1 hypothetical protein A5718_06765 [Mycolicibacterium conceptionense]OBF07004.1 hypothetical protein A5731_08395 [Mycolicibacterium conceptionense]OBF26578.1 hypothetical protein A5726_05230 [Mycolicibacterium conceptionense]OBF31178.1 hypothetical protein A5720_28905 [Mycolicibacterium conceptionense]